jgi:hypothetical protein
VSDQIETFTPKSISVDRIAVSEQVSWHIVHATCLKHLAGCPRSRRMLSGIEVENANSIMAQNHQYEQHPMDFPRYDDTADFT